MAAGRRRHTSPTPAISKAPFAAGSDELHQRAGPAVGGEGETRVRIDAGHLDIGGQTTRVVQGERAAGAHRILDETVRRRRLEKVRRVDRVAGPETADRGGEGLRLLERERVRAGLGDGLPGRNARVELKIGAFERLKDPAPPTAPASSSVSVAIEIEPLLVVAPDTSRAAKFVPLPLRSTVPLLTKEFAVTESDEERPMLPISSVPVLVSAPPIDRVEPPRA